MYARQHNGFPEVKRRKPMVTKVESRGERRMQGGSKQAHGAGQAQRRGGSKGQQASPQGCMSGCVFLAAGVYVQLSRALLARM